MREHYDQNSYLSHRTIDSFPVLLAPRIDRCLLLAKNVKKLTFLFVFFKEMIPLSTKDRLHYFLVIPTNIYRRKMYNRVPEIAENIISIHPRSWFLTIQWLDSQGLQGVQVIQGLGIRPHGIVHQGVGGKQSVVFSTTFVGKILNKFIGSKFTCTLYKN